MLELSNCEPPKGDKPIQRPHSSPGWTNPEPRRHSAQLAHPSNPLEEPMLTAPELSLLTPAWKPWLTGCMVHISQSLQLLSIPLQVEGYSVCALLNSGSTITLAQPLMCACLVTMRMMLTELPKVRLTPTLTDSCVYQQVSREENFGQEQKEDEWLKYCCSQVHVTEGENQQPGQPLLAS